MKERYESYRDSDIPWIGQVPEGWEVRRLKSICEIISGATPRTDDESCWDGDINWVTPADYTTEDKYVAHGKRNISAKGLNSCGTCLVPKGSVIFSKRAPIGTVAIAANDLCTNQGCLSCIPKENTDSAYCYYFLTTVTDTLNAFGNGTTFKEISTNDFASFPIPLPPLHVQRAIAGYLDARCAAIDAYVASLEREAALAREFKQAVIARAVTRGLDPNTPMRDSGIPWIGQVPQGWEVDELGRHFRERRTKVSDKEYEPLSVSKHGVTPQLDTACKTDNGDNRKLVCKGDFVVNSRSDRKGSCGLSDYVGSVSLINTVLEPIDMDGKYCHYLFRSNDYVEEFYRLGRGIVADLWTTRYDDMKVLKIPLPPLPEQRAIADYLDARCAAIDAYVASLEREAALVRELKAREIADAVTGKVKITA